MSIRQLSVFLENKAGRLADVTGVLGDAGVNILALALADTTDFGILRLIVDHSAKAAEALKAHNIVCITTDVTAIAVEDRPGGLARVLKLLVKQQINVEYMYAFSRCHAERAALILRFDEPERAVSCLQEAGVEVLGDDDFV